MTSFKALLLFLLISSSLLFSADQSKVIILQRNSADESFNIPKDKDQATKDDKGILWVDTTMSTHGSSASSGHRDTLAVDSLAIFLNTNSQHLKPIAYELAKDLETIHRLKKIHIIPHNKTFPLGIQSPDFFISLHIDEGEKKTVFYQGGSTYLGSFESYNSNSFTPNHYSFNGKIELSNYIWPNPTKKVLIKANKVAKNISTELLKILNSRLKEIPLRPSFPESFYPKYQAPPKFAFLEENNAKVLISTSALLCKNQTIWTFESNKAPKDLLPSLLTNLERNGWKKKALQIKERGIQYLRIGHEEKGLYLNISEQDKELSTWFKHQNNSHKYQVLFLDLHTTVETLSSIRTILNKTITAQNLDLCLNYIDDHSNSRNYTNTIDSILEESDLTFTPSQLLELAHWYGRTYWKKDELQTVDYYIQALLKNLWQGQSDDFKRENNISHFKKLNKYPTDTTLPFVLTDLERSKYKLRILANILNKEFEINTGNAFSFFLTKESVQAFYIYKKDSLTKEKVFVFRETEIKNDRSSGSSWGEIKLGDKKEMKFKVNDKSYIAKIHLNKNGKTYTVKVTESE